MATYRDSLSQVQSGWIHDLAKSEIHPEAEKLLQLGSSYDPNQLIEESAIQFLTELRDYFSEYVRVFNSYSEGGRRYQEIRLYSVAQSASDFMIFRNQIKLVIAASGHGIIQFGFAKHSSSAVMVNGQSGADAALNQYQEITAGMGPFRDVHWSYQGEKVQPEQLARFFFTEFVRTSRSPDRSKASNELLLKEVKAFLQQKGLEIN